MGSSILLGAVIFLAASVIKGMICKKNTFVRLICIGASAVVAFFGTLIFKSTLDDPSSVLEYAEGFLGYETISGINLFLTACCA